MKNMLLDTTTKVELCSHPILLSLDELEKVEKTFLEEGKHGITQIPQFINVKPTMPIVVYQRKETKMEDIKIMVQNVSV